jgi:hypothetical protein
MPVAESESSPTEMPVSNPIPSDDPVPISTPQPTPSESEIEEPKPELLDQQPNFSVRAPNSIAVDPRANISFLPRITFFGGGQTGILCVSANGFLDVGQKDLVSNDEKGAVQISGDLSSSLRITGNTAAINSVINSGNGLRVISNQRRIANSQIRFAYAALTMPSTDSSFCDLAPFRSQISFRALGLQLDNIKTRVDFNKP